VLGLLCGVITVAFVFTFGFRQGGLENTVAEVGPYKISTVEYRDLYNKTVEKYRALYRDKFDDEMKNELKLKDRVVDELVDRYLLLAQADRMGIRVTDKEYSEYLAGMGVLDKDGRLSDAFLEFLRKNGMDPKSFELSQKREMAIGKLLAIIGDHGTQVDEEAAYRSYLKERGQVRLSVAVFDPDDFKGKVSVEEKELNDLYEKEKAGHKSENTYHLKYMVIGEGSEVKDDQAYMDLLKSRDMSVYSRSKGIEVIDLGTMKESELNAKFGRLKIRERLKGMVKGDISLPIREGSKSYIFQIVDRAEGKPYEKGEVLRIIKARLIAEKAKTMARLEAEDAIKAKKVKFRKETPFLDRNTPVIQGIGQVPKEHAALLGLSKGQMYDKPVEMNDRYYVFAAADEKQPGKEQWEKEKNAYKQFFFAMSQQEMFTKLRDDLKKKIKVKIDRSAI
jgi:parvulin-like peptidyl-prolyl isomerase